MTSNLSRLAGDATLLKRQLFIRGWPAQVTFGTFLLLIVGIYFVKTGNALSVIPMAAGAVLALASGAAVRVMRQTLWFWGFLAFLALWLAIGALSGGSVWKTSDFLNIGLIGLFCLFTVQVSEVLSTTRILWIVALAGAASAVLSIGAHVATADHVLDRLIPLGRAGNPIPGAGGLAIAFIAVAALWREQDFSREGTSTFALLVVPLAAALVLTQSRAPLVALCVALLLALLLIKRGPALILSACGAVWLIIGGLIVFEPVLKRLACSNSHDWCRPSNRAQIWGWVRDQIMLHPLLGSGPSFRFTQEWMSHPHNGLFGITMYFGMIALAAFLIMIGFYVRSLVRQQDEMLRFFGLASLIFSFGYMGADLSNPFAYFNTHYLFMWFPLFLVLARAGEQTSRPMARR